MNDEFDMLSLPVASNRVSRRPRAPRSPLMWATPLWLAVILAFGSPLHAADRIWSAVVLATRENPPKPPPSRLKAFAGAMEKVFGYNTFYLMGEKTRDIRAGTEEWLVPSKRIYMRVAVLDADRTSYLIRIELYDGKELLVTAEARIARDAPLYIRGPEWGKGQLIALLEVR